MNTHTIHSSRPPGRRSFLLGLCLLMGLVWATPLAAQSKSDLAITLTAKRVVKGPDGKEILEAAEKAKPGDLIEYTGVFSNKSQGTLKNLKPVIPIPVGLDYVADSAKPKPSEGSLNGKVFSPLPLKRSVTQANGQTKEEDVPLSAYRAIRWSVDELKSGAAVTMSLRANVVSVTSPATK